MTRRNKSGSEKRQRRREREGTLKNLHAALEVANEVGEDFGDGAWMAHLESTVEQFNEDCGTDFDPNTAVMDWLAEQES
jgi:hypothetical protein